MIRPLDVLFLTAVLVVAAAGPAEVLARSDDGQPASMDPRTGDHSLKVAQVDATDLVVRLDRLEEQIRQLTGTVEQLQYRNQQLEQQMRRIQPGAAESRPADSGPPAARYSPPTGPMGTPAQGDRLAGGGDGAPSSQAPGAPLYLGNSPEPPVEEPAVIPAPQYGERSSLPPPPPPQSGPRHGAVFDPNQNPNAPGAPRPLGQVAAGTSQGYTGASPIGVGVAPPPAPRYSNATGGQQLVMAPTSSAKDEYDLAYGYVLRKDYALAEASLRAFLKQFPNDRLTPDATYWLGESLFQLQRYRDAAEAFLTVSTKFESGPKGPESLMRLGQSLAALGEKEAACSTFGQVGRKYPRAAHLRQTVEREQKRVGC